MREAPSTGEAATARLAQDSSTGMAARFGKISITPPNFSTNHSSRKPFSINTRVLLPKSYPEQWQEPSTSGRPCKKEPLHSQMHYQDIPALSTLQCQEIVLHFPSPTSKRRPILSEERGALGRTVQYLVVGGLQPGRPLCVSSPI